MTKNYKKQSLSCFRYIYIYSIRSLSMALEDKLHYSHFADDQLEI